MVSARFLAKAGTRGAQAVARGWTASRSVHARIREFTERPGDADLMKGCIVGLGVLGACLSVARIASAETGIEGASRRDAAASRGMFLPGGLTAPGGSVSFEIETVPV